MATDGSTIDKPINGEWRTAKFGDCARLVTDRVSPQTAGDTPYIGLEHIGESTLSLIGHGTAQDVTSTKTLFKRKDILFGKLRPYFRKVIAAPFGGICSTDIWVVRPKEGVDAGFLFYTMATLDFVERAVRGSNGTRMPRASWDFLSEYELSLPPLPTQRAISRVLGAFDDKIALNAEMNATLDAMAQALFRSWFVDFEPVRAKQEGRWRRGETLPGMPAALYDIFPAELTSTELGDVPAGWGVCAFGDIVSQSLDKEKPFESPDAMFSHFSIPAYTANKMPTMDKGSTIKSVKSIVKLDTVLLSRLNPQIPRVWLVDVAADERAVCSTEFMVLSAKAPFRRNYIYFLGQTERFHAQVQSIVTGVL